jgi:hypothetical protein
VAYRVALGDLGLGVEGGVENRLNESLMERVAA